MAIYVFQAVQAGIQVELMTHEGSVDAAINRFNFMLRPIGLKADTSNVSERYSEAVVGAFSDFVIKRMAAFSAFPGSFEMDFPEVFMDDHQVLRVVDAIGRDFFIAEAEKKAVELGFHAPRLEHLRR